MDKETRERFIKAVEGTNQERDFLILEYHALNPDHTAVELIKNTGIEISEQRVGQILKANSLLILKVFAQTNPLYFKEGRAIELIKMYKRKTKLGVATGKDAADILDVLRKEIEGDHKTSIGVTIHNKGEEGADVTFNKSERELQNRILADLEADSQT